MKKVLILLSIFSYSGVLFAQAPSIQWQKSLGGTMGESGEHIVPTSDGGFIVCGSSASNDGDVTGHHGTSATADAWVIKLDNSGNIQWQKSYGGSQDDQFLHIRPTSDGGYIAAGFTRSNDGDVVGHHGTSYDIWVVKLNSLGIIQWQKSLGGTYSESCRTIIELSGGGYVIAGASTSNDGDVTGHFGPTGGFNDDMWFVKLSSTGSIVWQKSFGGSAYDQGVNIIEQPDGSFIALGSTTSSDGAIAGAGFHGGTDGVFMRISSSGVVTYAKCLGGSAIDLSYGIVRRSSNEYIITGSSASTNGDLASSSLAGGYDGWISKVDSNGTFSWTRLFGGSSDEIIGAIEQTIEGGFILHYDSGSPDGDVTGFHPGSSLDYWIVKTDSVGIIDWEQCYGGTGYDRGTNTRALSSAGEYISVGYTDSANYDVNFIHGDFDIWVIRLSEPVGINENNISKSGLLQAYPNPFSNELSFSYDAGNSDLETLKLEVINVLGQVVAEKSLQENSGIFKMTITGNSGVYIARLISGSELISSRRIIKTQ